LNLNKNKNITYAIGFVKGTFSSESVYVNDDIYVQNLQFLLVDHEVQLAGTVADGVLGLGIDLEGNDHNSFVMLLYGQGKISRPAFTFYISESRRDSRLYIGDITENTHVSSLINSRMQFCDVNIRSRYWMCSATYISVENNDNNNKINGKSYPRLTTTSSKVIFDTGTSYLIVPANDFMALLPNFLDGAYNRTCGLTPMMQFICKCNSPDEFGDIVISFANSRFVIKTKDIIQYFPTLEFQCRFELIVDIQMMDAWILGDSVLKYNLKC
jgi:hypothetical protein